MRVQDMLGQARDSFTVKRVFGEPYKEGAVTVIPVAQIMGGAGGGSGGGDHNGSGSGSGFGVRARPAGVYVIKGDNVTWRPAFDVNRIIAGAQFIIAIFLLTIRAIVKMQAKRHAVAIVSCT